METGASGRMPGEGRRGAFMGGKKRGARSGRVKTAKGRGIMEKGAHSRTADLGAEGKLEYVDCSSGGGEIKERGANPWRSAIKP